MANKKNLATTQLTASLNATATSVSVKNGAVLPTAPFFATIMPANEVSNSDNSEIVSVSAVAGGSNLLAIATPKDVWQATYNVSGGTASLVSTGTSGVSYAMWQVGGNELLGKKLNVSWTGNKVSSVQVRWCNGTSNGAAIKILNASGEVAIPDTMPSGMTGVSVLFYVEIGETATFSNVLVMTDATLTIARAQKGTTAKAFEADAILTNAIYLDELAFNDGGVLKDSSGSNMTLGAGNLKNMAVGLAGLRLGWMVAKCGTAVTGSGASSALGLTEEASAGNLLEIKTDRVRAKEAGLALVSGACYAKGGSAQVFANIVKYNVAGDAFTRYGRQAWTSTNETAGTTLTLPMVPIPMAVGESLTIVGGSSSTYTIGGGGDAYNGIEVLFIPSAGAN